jgi:hypothetical protein
MDDGRPAVVTDHVLVAVADLEAGARWIESEYGLRAVPGGRHPGAGTANMIVPLGSAYLELIGIVDPEEAARSQTSVRITRALAENRKFATWAARTDNLEALRRQLLAAGWQLEAPREGSRVRGDGVVLRWRTQFLAPPGAPSVLPFVIEWSIPRGTHPGQMPADHPSRAQGIRSVRLGDPDPAAADKRLRSALGAGLNASVERAPTSGVVAVEIETPTGVVVLR